MELLDSIKKYLARFEAQVRISTFNNEYNINKHSENVIIPILNLVYSSNFKNANFTEVKNNEAVDLIDYDKRVAFQITSTTSIQKVKDTITKLVASKYIKLVDQLYILMLQPKQTSYTQIAINKVAKNKLKFNYKEHILDFANLYKKIDERNDISIFEAIEARLRNNFSDVYIHNSFTLNDLEEFKSKYKQSCLINFSRINFFGLSVNSTKPRNIELYQLFVSPRFSTEKLMNDYISPIPQYSLIESNIQTEKENGKRELIMSAQTFRKIIFDTDILTQFGEKSGFSLKEFTSISLLKNIWKKSQNEIANFSELFSGSQHIAVIGSPGAGKSSFIKYAICKIQDDQKEVFNNQEIYEYVPFRIELHKYNKFRKTKTLGIIDYLVDMLKMEYQSLIEKDQLISVIKAFPTLFFFDGLDEIFDIHERLDVRNNIEAFVSSYSLIRSLVTSRKESYEEVSLSEKLYAKYEILDFDDEQVEEYINKWYAIEESDESTRKAEVKSCIHQLKNIETELKHNPLLLSLILLLYRSESEIPTSKLSIYESCTNTIVETRDVKEKKLDITIKISNKISIFAYLAFWQYTNESKGVTIPTYDFVKRHIKGFLMDRGVFDEESIASSAAEEFLDFAKVRSIFFENKFTHKTFLEYFTAYYIYSNYFNKWGKEEELFQLLSGYIGLSAWSVVLELLVCKIDANQIDYEIIDKLFDNLYETNETDTLLFFLQISKYLNNISPKKLSFIISNSLNYCFKVKKVSEESKQNYIEILFDHLCVISTTERFMTLIIDSFNAIIEEGLVNKNNIVVFAYEFAIVSGKASLINLCQEKIADIVDEYIFILRYYPSLFNEDRFLETLKLFISKYGIPSVSHTYQSHFLQKIFYDSDKFNWCISYLFNGIGEKKFQDKVNALQMAGIPKEVLLNAANTKSIEITEKVLDNIQLLNASKSSSIKQLLRTLRKTNFPNQTNIVQKKENFYEKFFVNQVKASRRPS